MCDGVIFIILLSLIMCVTLRPKSYFKEIRPSAPKFPEYLNNILGAGGWREPNIFRLPPKCIYFLIFQRFLKE